LHEIQNQGGPIAARFVLKIGGATDSTTKYHAQWSKHGIETQRQAPNTIHFEGDIRGLTELRSNERARNRAVARMPPRGKKKNFVPIYSLCLLL